MAQKGTEFGVDGNKKVKGRKRHVMVDVLGLVVSCYVSAVNLANVKAAPAIGVPALENNARLVKVLADQVIKAQLPSACNRHTIVSWNSRRSWDKVLGLSRGGGWSSARSRG